MQVFAYITSAITNTERRLTLANRHGGALFVFDDTGTDVIGTFVEPEDCGNKFAALDSLRRIYADPAWKLRFELV